MSSPAAIQHELALHRCALGIMMKILGADGMRALVLEGRFNEAKTRFDGTARLYCSVKAAQPAVNGNDTMKLPVDAPFGSAGDVIEVAKLLIYVIDEYEALLCDKLGEAIGVGTLELEDLGATLDMTFAVKDLEVSNEVLAKLRAL